MPRGTAVCVLAKEGAIRGRRRRAVLLLLVGEGKGVMGLMEKKGWVSRLLWAW
jgi:hypothetical protein